MHSIQNDSTGLGQRLAQAREAAGLAHSDVSAALHMPVHIVQALERDDFERLGATVFVRGQLRSYARLLKLQVDADIDRALASTPMPAELVSHTHTPRVRRLLEQGARRVVYIAITAAILVPVWLATKPHLSNSVQLASLDPIAPTGEQVSESVSGPTPVVASIATLPSRAPAAPALTLVFEGDSWLEVTARDGTSIERGMRAAGDRRVFAAGEVGRIKFGNASAVRVLNRGAQVDMAAFSAENVARFAVSSDGSVASLAD